MGTAHARARTDCSCGRLHTALRYLDKALHIEAMFDACDNPAGTHLNVCAILSQMGRYVRAPVPAFALLGSRLTGMHASATAVHSTMPTSRWKS